MRTYPEFVAAFDRSVLRQPRWILAFIVGLLLAMAFVRLGVWQLDRLDQRRSAVVGQFCRKLLGYALGRETQLSDQPLLAEMQQKLAENGYRTSTAVLAIVQSRQFREIRGRDTFNQESP